MKKLFKMMMSCLLVMTLVMTSLPGTVNAASKKENAVIVSTQEALEKALLDSSITSIKISTKKTVTFTIPQGKYTGVSLVVDAGKATIKNNGTFSKLTIDNAKKLAEYAMGNTIVVNDDKLTLNTAKGAKITKLAIKSKSGQITIGNKGTVSKLKVAGESSIDLEQNGKIGRITLSAPAEVDISGNATSKTYITVKTAATGTVITSSVPVGTRLYGGAALVLEEGAEGSAVALKRETAEAAIENNAGEGVGITDSEGKQEDVNAGEAIGTPVEEIKKNLEEKIAESSSTSEQDASTDIAAEGNDENKEDAKTEDAAKAEEDAKTEDAAKTEETAGTSTGSGVGSDSETASVGKIIIYVDTTTTDSESTTGSGTTTGDDEPAEPQPTEPQPTEPQPIVKNGDETTYEDGKKVVTTYSNDKKVKVVYYNADGSKDSEEEYDADEKLNKTTKYSYNEDGSKAFEAEYDGDNKLMRVTYFDAAGSIESYVESEYDVAGNVTKETIYNADGSRNYVNEYGKGKILEKKTYYNANGNPEIEKYLNADGSLNQRKVYTYDENNNLKTSTTYNSVGNKYCEIEYFVGDNREKDTYYQTNGSIDYSVELEYYADGELKKEIIYRADESKERECEYHTDGSKTEIYYNADGSRDCEKEYDTDENVISRTEYAYDIDGKLTRKSTCDAHGTLIQWQDYIYEVVTLDSLGDLKNMGNKEYYRITRYVNDIKENVQYFSTDDTEALLLEEKYAYDETTWTLDSFYEIPQKYFTLRTYKAASARLLEEIIENPSDRDNLIVSTYTYDGDICTLTSTRMDQGDKVVTIRVYTTDATGTEVIKELSRDVCTYDGNSNKIKQGTSWYFSDSGNLVVNTDDRLPDGNLRNINRIYKSDITEYRDDPSFLNNDALLTNRTTAVTRPDGSCVSTKYEHGTDLKYYELITRDEYDNILSLTKQEIKEDKVVVTKEDYIYSGEGKDKILTGRTSKRTENDVLVSTQIAAFTLEGGRYFCDNVLISYISGGTERCNRTETHFEILNGQSIFTMSEKEDMRIWWTKSYGYYSVPGDNDNYHYRLKASREYEYNLLTPNKYSLLTETTYTYDTTVGGVNNNYTVTTTIMNEDGSGSSEQSSEERFNPEEGVHLFTESIPQSTQKQD